MMIGDIVICVESGDRVSYLKLKTYQKYIVVDYGESFGKDMYWTDIESLDRKERRYNIPFNIFISLYEYRSLQLDKILD
jgi:hypothetical protein